ncbi:ABC transporter permease [Acuticoccus sediminis]|uniref:ABC transporter permease n=1 Tax=Acuticoccus sediminis TaxID=2184697 RepID=UPI001CFD6014|nr:ABC transporter permease [Acuticoccus sediminis]
MNVFVDVLASAGLWEAVLRIATPLIFGTLGALLCERSGVLNLGIEGIMTFGAMIAWLTVFGGANLWVGLLAAAACGALFGLLHAAMTVPLGLSQHVTGLGITLLASSLAYYLFRLAIPVQGTPPTVEPFQPVGWAWLDHVPVVGPLLAAQTAPTFLALAMVPILAYVLAATPLGLAIRMTGENPHAAEAQGIDPIATRIGAVVAGSALMALGGAFLTLSAFNSFFPTMVQGRGWVSIALVVFAMWRPWRALLGALLFALFDAYQLRLQAQLGKEVPYQLFLMMPYVLSIAALVVMARRARVPQALMQPYRRGER